MIKEAIFHRSDIPYAFAVGPNQLKVRIRAKINDLVQCFILYDDRYEPAGTEEMIPMRKVASDELFDYFEAIIEISTRRPRYQFYLRDKEGFDVWYGEKGFASEAKDAGVFQFPYICDKDIYTIPDWVTDAVVYQIFPERFYNGDKKNDPEKVHKWGEPPKADTFFGGDLKGIIEKLPYLSELGINTIYLTPVFQSPSTHKYDTTDYYMIDPHFGDIETCKELVNECHKIGIRVILDAVFNHCGYDFFAFQDVIKNGKKSKYVDWFNVYSFPVKKSPKPNYETFAKDVWSMPKLMTRNPEVREYLLGVARYWIEEVGIDGWRLDVSNEIDHDFWRAFRKVVKQANPEALIIGEIWHDAGPWLRGDEYDSVMNYLFRDAVIDFFAKKSIGISTFDARLAKTRMIYPDQATYAMFNLLDSHDTERFLTTCEEKEEQLRLAVLFQMTYIGMPMIYYGDEIGMVGENDPDCRRTMIWDEKKQNKELLQFYKKLLQIRNKFTALRKGEFYTWVKDPLTNVYGYLRKHEDETVAILINNGLKERTVEVDVDWLPENVVNLKDQLSGESYPIKGKKLSLVLPAYGAVILA
ncbi:MAG: cyclomaltodextrinase / maltogenic alpha-amylase / neopullulanase [Petroclostridium sp.]|jgi:glycosidase|uniref:alpha-glycosidase n=1 Tax=Petroclostridium xylanilyticum TaxID=1792311 RepID=UPI000B995196|nr:alpha-glycosidase [Petroclostridium xylanilyticum]MBZ4644902.1 hypothetical protein [Clostridia bacterium]MDK2809381.1 cyclomaltodextrinase / maltogenic alpha-amylase / neopullulanase [Petroclostridium sp.]